MPRYPISICIVPRDFTNHLREWGSPVRRWLEADHSLYWFADLRSRLLFGYPMRLLVPEICLSERHDSFIILSEFVGLSCMLFIGLMLLPYPHLQNFIRNITAIKGQNIVTEI